MNYSPKCCVPNCSNTWELTKNKVIYFRFPTNEDVKQKWFDAIKWSDEKPGCNHCVCADHFKPEDLGSIDENTTIVPTVFKPEFVDIKIESDLIDSSGLTISSEVFLNPEMIKNEVSEEIELGPFEMTDTPIVSNIENNIPTQSVKREIEEDDIELDCYQIIDTPDESDNEIVSSMSKKVKLEHCIVGSTKPSTESVQSGNGDNTKVPLVTTAPTIIKEDNFEGQLCEIMMSQKQTKLLWLNGFSYSFHTITNKWRCTMRNNKTIKCSCNLRAKEEDGKYYVTKFFKTHNHPPDAGKLAVSKFLSSIKETAGKSNNMPGQILQTAIEKLPENIAGCLPSKPALKQMIKRQKKKSLEKEPESIAFDIPFSYQQIDGEKFLFGDITDGEDRLINFTTHNNLIRLSNAEFWLITFKVIPKVFYQLCTIHCSIGPHNSIHSMVYSLMSSKSNTLYEKIFTNLNESALEIGIHLAPKLVITNFDEAAINTIRTIYDQVTIKGCNFDFKQNMYKHIQRIGWQTRYGIDIGFALKIRQIAALCFLEPNEIPEYFNEIKADFGAEFDPLTDWLGENYIFGENGRAPLFPPSLWSVLDHYENGLSQTQKYAESFHYYISNVIGRSHIGVFSLIKDLQKKAKETNTEIKNLVTLTNNARTLDKEMKLYLILNRKHEFSNLEFLKAIAANISF